MLPCSGGSSKPGQDQTTYEVDSDDMLDGRTSALRKQIVQFCKAAHETTTKISCNWVLIFLGSEKRARVSFRAPEAFHHAHWMVKGIYSIKIFMLHQQFSLTAKEKPSKGDGTDYEPCLCSVLAWSTSGYQSTTQWSTNTWGAKKISKFECGKKLPRLHCVCISGTFRKFWSACRWQTSAFHNPSILRNALTVLLSPSALLALPFGSQRGLLWSLMFCNLTEKRRRKASFRRILKNYEMILPTRTSGWQHQPWQSWMTLMKESLLWCSSTLYNMPLTKNEEQKQLRYQWIQ